MIYILFFTILSAQPTYEFEIIAIPEMDTPIRMNDDGSEIVGTNYSGQALLWTDSVGVQILGEGELWGISEDGRIFGEMVNDNGYGEAALIENGEISFLGNVEGGNSCDAFYSSGLGISTDGSTGVGMGWISCGTEAFYWTDEDGIVGLGQYEGQSTKAQAVSGDGQLIGGWAQTSNRATCLWNRDGNITLLGSLQAGNDYGEVQAINNNGTQVVGYCAGNAGNNTEGFVWTEEGGMFGLGVPPNSAATNRSLAMDISENNVVIGQYLNETPVFYKACIYTEETGEFVNLRDYLLNLGMEEIQGWDLQRAFCISDDGNVFAGYGKDPSNNWTGWRIRIIVGEAPGEMLLVPSEYSTIQDAINASEDGDTVLVSPGTYVENINYSGKNIVIGSYFMTYGMDYFIGVTIIQGDYYHPGPLVTFDNGEAGTAELNGFTITNSFIYDIGGGIYCENSDPTLKHLIVKNNFEGGIYLFNSNSRLENLTVTDNSKNDMYHGGAGIFAQNSSITIHNSLIANNWSGHGGWAVAPGGIDATSSEINLDGVTMYGNASGSLILKEGSSGTIHNSIIWNYPDNDNEFEIEIIGETGYGTASELTISYSDILGGFDGINAQGVLHWLDGNIDNDPLFCLSDSTDFTLAENSPCVGMGEYEADMGAFGIGCEAILATHRDNMPLQYALYQNYPNPFNPTTTFRYDLPKDAFVKITIYDMMGRIVNNLVSSQQNTGYKSIQWNATNNVGQPVSAGLYLYTIDAEQFRQAKKMVLLK